MAVPSSTEGVVLSGSCSCGFIKYTSTSLPTIQTACYCEACRFLGSAPYLAFFQFPVSAITFTTNKPAVTKLSEIAERTVCAGCKDSIAMYYHCQMDKTGIVAGTIDRDSVKGELPPLGVHIFVGDKEKGYELPDDGIPRFEGHTPDFEAKLEAWAASHGVELPK